MFQGIWAELRNTHNLRMDVKRKINTVETGYFILRIGHL